MGVVVVRWGCARTTTTAIATTEQRTTIKTGIKTIRRTGTRLGTEPLARKANVEPLFVRQNTSGVAMQSFHRTVFEAHARRQSPKGPTNYVRSSC